MRKRRFFHAASSCTYMPTVALLTTVSVPLVVAPLVIVVRGGAAKVVAFARIELVSER